MVHHHCLLEVFLKMIYPSLLKHPQCRLALINPRLFNWSTNFQQKIALIIFIHFLRGAMPISHPGFMNTRVGINVIKTIINHSPNHHRWDSNHSQSWVVYGIILTTLGRFAITVQRFDVPTHDAMSGSKSWDFR